MNSALQQLNSPFGSFQLHRIPHKKQETLRAWDAADEYLLHHLAENQCLTSGNKVLVVNDQFGALAVALSQYQPQSWSDSYINELATQHNLKLNRIPLTGVHAVPSTAMPQGILDVVIIKIPKISALLEDQLIKIKPHIDADTLIIAASMVRNIHTSTLKIFENVLGTTHTSLAVKKARLIFTHYEKSAEDITPPYPNNYHVKTLGIYLSNHANVFSKDKLDFGSQLMLSQYKQLPQAQHIVDLGCGNGILGIMAQRQLTESNVTFLDESYMAVASAKMNYENLCADSNDAAFIVSNGLSNLPDDHVDLILCNPPFHQQHTIGDETAWRMFTASFKQLQSGGQLWVVGNRHLQYLSKLKKIFGNSRELASDQKFQVIVAKKA